MRGGSGRGLQSRGLAPPYPSRPDRCQGDHLPGLPFSQAHIALSPRLTRLTQESLAVLPFPSCRRGIDSQSMVQGTPEGAPFGGPWRPFRFYDNAKRIAAFALTLS